MNTIEKYENEGYQGNDASLEISLFEYGLIWKEEENEYLFIYGVHTNGEEYSLFDWGCISKDIYIKKEFDWVDWKGVLSFVGENEEDYLKHSIPLIVSDLLSYYGYENVFGSAYSPFEIVS